jgi:hypothetical protein
MADEGISAYGLPALDSASEVVRSLQGARDSGRSPWMLVLRHPAALTRAAVTILRLPWLGLSLSPAPAGAAIRRYVGARTCGLPTGRLGRGVLALPESEEAYLAGRHRQAVRTNVRKARVAGVTCRPVGLSGERLQVARRVYAGRANDDQVSLDWLEERLGAGDFFVACGPADDAVAFASVLVDGGAAYLEFFISSQDHEVAACARYLLHLHLVVELRRTGVAHLVSDSLLAAPPGVRYFQHLVGFEPANVRLRRRR